MKLKARGLSCPAVSQALEYSSFPASTCAHFENTHVYTKANMSSLLLRHEPFPNLHCFRHSSLDRNLSAPYQYIKKHRKLLVADVVCLRNVLNKFTQANFATRPVNDQIRTVIKKCVKVVNTSLVELLSELEEKRDEWEKFKMCMEEILVYCDILLTESHNKKIVIEGVTHLRLMKYCIIRLQVFSNKFLSIAPGLHKEAFKDYVDNRHLITHVGQSPQRKLDFEALIGSYSSAYDSLIEKDSKERFLNFISVQYPFHILFHPFKPLTLLPKTRAEINKKARIASSLKLVCRNCDQKVPLDKYMTHSEICLSMTENKRKLQDVDQAILITGETITGKIKELSRKMLHSKGQKDPQRNRETSSILQRYANNMPASVKIRPQASPRPSPRVEEIPKLKPPKCLSKFAPKETKRVLFNPPETNLCLKRAMQRFLASAQDSIAFTQKAKGNKNEEEKLSNKEEIEVLNKLRSVSRIAYSLKAEAFNSSLTQLQKLLGNLRALYNQYRHASKIPQLIETIIKCLNDKARLIQKIKEAAIQLVRFGAKRTEVGTPRPTHLPIIEEAEVEDDSPINYFSENRATSRKHTTSSQTFMPKHSPYHGPTLVRPPPQPLVKEKSKTKRTPKQCSNSTTPQRRKPFDPTLGEEQMERIFSRRGRQKAARLSYTFELDDNNKENERVVDERLNNSSALDYTIQYFISGTRATRRCNSAAKRLSKCIRLEDLETVKTIRAGRKIVVKRKEGDEMYVMDIVKRLGISEKFQDKFVVMKLLNNKHIAKLCCIVLEKERTVFLSEYVKGTDLETLLKRNERVNARTAKKYITEIIKGLEYLHGHSLVHKSLTLENVIVSGVDGEIKLTNYWLSSRYQPRSPASAKNYTNALAPETTDEEKISPLSNWWALGIIGHAMLLGNLSEDLLALEESTDMAVDFIKRLLEPDPKKRLGRGGASEVKAHPFFAETKWDLY